MQALRIRLPGNFYDSQIYDKHLYLWCIDGSIMVLKWEALVEKSIAKVDEKLRITLEILLKNGQELYCNKLMKNPEVNTLIGNQIQILHQQRIEFTKKDFLNDNTHQNLFPFPHSDVKIFRKGIYVASQQGISRSISNSRPEKISDIPSFSIDISNYRLAIASGDEGLFYHWLKSNSKNDPNQLSKEECNLTRWMYPNIFMSSYSNLGNLARFKELNKKKESDVKAELKNSYFISSKDDELAVLDYPPEIAPQNNSSHDKIEFLGMVPSEKIFNVLPLDLERQKRSKIQFVWGVEDKIYWAREKAIEIFNYKSSKHLGNVNIENLTDEIISADSSFFGVVLEMEEGLLVIDSLLQSHFIGNEPVNWRVFPKSKNYINHLHVIYDDYMDIYIFTHDYFVNQENKRLGIGFFSS